MDQDALIASLRQAAPGAEFESVPTVDLQPTVYVPREAFPAVARALRELPALHFDFLAELTAADFWPREPRFEVVYIVVSTTLRHRARLKVRVRGDDARMPTVCGVWPAANWLEREVWDLFGIVFERHPDLRRLLMPEDWEGFPLRKDYPVQIQAPVRTTEPLQVSEQEFRANLERDRLVRRT
jgi:NADH-quinone oxidoreductase subunit C